MAAHCNVAHVMWAQVKKRLAAGFYHRFPSEDYIEAVYTREKAVSMRKLKEIDVPPDLDFSYHYFNMILATTVQVCLLPE